MDLAATEDVKKVEKKDPEVEHPVSSEPPSETPTGDAATASPAKRAVPPAGAVSSGTETTIEIGPGSSGTETNAEPASEAESAVPFVPATFSKAGSSSFESLWNKLDSEQRHFHSSPRRANSFDRAREGAKPIAIIRTTHTFDSAQIDDRRSNSSPLFATFSPERKRSIAPDLARVDEDQEGEENEESNVSKRPFVSLLNGSPGASPRNSLSRIVAAQEAAQAAANAVLSIDNPKGNGAQPNKGVGTDAKGVAGSEQAPSVPSQQAIADSTSTEEGTAAVAHVATAAAAEGSAVIADTAIVPDNAAATEGGAQKDAPAVVADAAAATEDSEGTEDDAAGAAATDAATDDAAGPRSKGTEGTDGTEGTETREPQAVPVPPKTPLPSNVKHGAKPTGGRRLSLY
jgi:hypothetical protein